VTETQILQRPTLLSPLDETTPAFRVGERTIGWSELENRARMVANAISQAGVEPGQAWAVLSHNCLEWPEWTLGNARAGTRIVPLNWHLTATELAALLIDSGTKLMVVGEGLEEVASQAAEMAGVDRIITLSSGEYEHWLADAGDDLLTERQGGSPMLFTGGTTGRSKGVLRADSKLLASDWPNFWSGWGTLVRMPEEGLALVSTPLYHAMGLAVMGAAISKGMGAVALERFTPEGILSAIQEHRITATPMVPTQFIRLLKLSPEVRTQYDLSSIQWVLHTAAPCPEWAKREMISWFGPVIYEMYGSSEGTGPAICDSHEWLAHPGTVGKASARVEYSIVDDDGNDLPAGEIGTIYARRPEGGPEYHGSPEKTAASRLPDGRFTVGDLGWLDEDGYLFLADRRVDLIITGGANVYPAELEATLIEHPDVADIAVFGVPDPEWGHKIIAVIQKPEDRDVDVESVREFAKDRLASYKIPRTFDVVDALPREAHGKLKKHLLRDSYTASQSG
jgi:long-chain acyl-CoA synthetase